jgi:hypothetical protein
VCESVVLCASEQIVLPLAHDFQMDIRMQEHESIVLDCVLLPHRGRTRNRALMFDRHP